MPTVHDNLLGVQMMLEPEDVLMLMHATQLIVRPYWLILTVLVSVFRFPLSVVADYMIPKRAEALLNRVIQAHSRCDLDCFYGQCDNCDADLVYKTTLTVFLVFWVFPMLLFMTCAGKVTTNSTVVVFFFVLPLVMSEVFFTNK